MKTVYDQVCDQVWSRTWGQVHGTVGDQFSNKVWREWSIDVTDTDQVFMMGLEQVCDLTGMRPEEDDE